MITSYILKNKYLPRENIFYSQSVKYCSFIHGKDTDCNSLGRRGWKAVQILSVCYVFVSEDLLPGNENKTTIIVYIDVAWKLVGHFICAPSAGFMPIDCFLNWQVGAIFVR